MGDDRSFDYTVPDEFEYDGLILPGEIYKKDVLDRLKAFDFSPGDVLLAPYSKAGEHCAH